MQTKDHNSHSELVRSSHNKLIKAQNRLSALRVWSIFSGLMSLMLIFGLLGLQFNQFNMNKKIQDRLTGNQKLIADTISSNNKENQSTSPSTSDLTLLKSLSGINLADLDLERDKLLSFDDILNNQKVLGISNKDAKLPEINDQDLAKITTITTNIPATVRILSAFCATPELKLGDYTTHFDQDICTIYAFGSGFFINSEGYLATNGHVVSPSPDDFLTICAKYCSDEIIQATMISLLSTQFFNPYLNPVAIPYWQAMIDAQSVDIEIARRLIVDFAIDIATYLDLTEFDLNLTEQYYTIQLNDYSIENAINPNAALMKDVIKYSSSIKRAELVASDYSFKNLKLTNASGEAILPSSDLAILKIAEDDSYLVYPSVPIAEDTSKLQTGDKMTVIGYPGNSELLSSIESSSATVTSGSISSIINTSGDTHRLIQTTASLDHGNSGGPAFNDAGEVIGIATYALDHTVGTFNYLIDAEELSDLIYRSKLSNYVSSTTSSYKEGLIYFQASHYSEAKEKFLKVEELYSPHLNVANFINQSQDNILAGKDIRTINRPWGLIISLVLFFFVLPLFIILIAKSRRQHHLVQNLDYAHQQLTNRIPMTFQYNKV